MQVRKRKAVPSLVSDAIEDADLDGEGAVNLAFAELGEEKRRGALGSVKSSIDFARPLKTVLYEVINDQIHQERDGPIARRHGAHHPAETRDQFVRTRATHLKLRGSSAKITRPGGRTSNPPCLGRLHRVVKRLMTPLKKVVVFRISELVLVLAPLVVSAGCVRNSVPPVSDSQGAALGAAESVPDTVNRSAAFGPSRPLPRSTAPRRQRGDEASYHRASMLDEDQGVGETFGPRIKFRSSGTSARHATHAPKGPEQEFAESVRSSGQGSSSVHPARARDMPPTPRRGLNRLAQGNAAGICHRAPNQPCKGATGSRAPGETVLQRDPIHRLSSVVPPFQRSELWRGSS
jgi:hypothetical protein